MEMREGNNLQRMKDYNYKFYVNNTWKSLSITSDYHSDAHWHQ